MRTRLSIGVAAALLAAATVVSAQETTGTLDGRLTDTQGLAVPGATVTVIGPQGTKSAVSDDEGRFQIPFLTPGRYDVRAELQGFKAVEVKGVGVSLGQTQTINLKMEVGGLAETVEVMASTIVIDTTSSTTGAVLDSEFLARVPVGRRLTDTLYLAPGVSSTTTGRANPSMAGGSGLDNLYVVDGVNITNAGYGAVGSYSIVFGSLGTATPFDFVKEVQVKTGGYEAEFGQSMGGVVNVVTKSGTNELRGSVFGYARPDALEGEYKTVQTPNGVVNTVAQNQSDAGIEGGFPIMRDRLFFFGAINPSWETRSFIAPEGFPLESLGEVDRERRLLSYSAKGTYQLTPSHRIDASFFGDPSTGEMGPQRASSLLVGTTASFSEIEFGGHNQSVRYDGVLGSNWLLEASVARAKNVIEEVPSVNEWRVTNTIPEPDVITGGIGFYEAGNDGENLQYVAKMTNVFGGHQLKYGILYEDVTFSQLQQRTGPTITAHDGRQTATGALVQILPDVTFGQIYRVTRADFTSARDTRQDYVSFFVQDSWKAHDRLTVNAGVRYDTQSLIGTFAQLPTLDGEFLDEFALKNNWAPRVGVVYDPLGNGRSKLYGNYGRFFARVPNDLAARVLSADESVTRGDYFDANLTRPIADGIVTRTSPTAAAVTSHFISPGSGIAGTFIDPDAKLSAKDELVVGFEWEAIPNMNLGIRYIYRTVSRVLEDVAPFPTVACDFGDAQACEFHDYVLTNPDANTNVIRVAGLPGADQVRFEDPAHSYNAVELTMDRRLSNNWTLLASYRWSRLHGNYEGFFREDNGQSDPGLTSLYDFPTGDPTFTGVGGSEFHYLGDIRFLGELGEGPLPLDRPHQVKVFGNYTFGNGLGLGLGVNASSGKPLTAMAALAPYDNSGEIPLTPRGAGFETVDGFKERTPFEYQLDAQASYNLTIGGRRLTLLADAFNLFNIRRTIDYNAFVEDPGFGIANPDFGTATSGNVSGQMIQAPFALRLGARFEW
ncbi:MAG: TonB-dependent receptor domain-containing protein [Vicinamibacterales bacterium]